MRHFDARLYHLWLGTFYRSHHIHVLFPVLLPFIQLLPTHRYYSIAQYMYVTGLLAGEDDCLLLIVEKDFDSYLYIRFGTFIGTISLVPHSFED